MDGDSDNDNDNENGVLTGFLFGNIDSKGQLEDDIFDSESKKQLSSLARFVFTIRMCLKPVGIERNDCVIFYRNCFRFEFRLGLDSLLEELQQEDRDGGKSPNDNSADDANDKDSDEDYEKKSDTAIDFSEITELAEDLQTTMQAAKKENGDDYDDVEEAIPATKVSADAAETVKNDSATDTNTNGNNNESKGKDNDKELMPPPSIPLKTQTSTESNKSESSESAESKADKKLETPLAAMLPSKYANVDVRDLFPDFRPDKVLRFSRLFGPGKPSSLPQIWRSVRRKRRRRKHSRDVRVSNTNNFNNDLIHYFIHFIYGFEYFI